MMVARDGSLSRALAEAALGWRWADLPRDVQRQALRSLVNFFACALAGFRDPAVTTAARVLARVGPQGVFTRIGSGTTASLFSLLGNVKGKPAYTATGGCRIVSKKTRVSTPRLRTTCVVSVAADSKGTIRTRSVVVKVG